MGNWVELSIEYGYWVTRKLGTSGLGKKLVWDWVKIWTLGIDEFVNVVL